MGFEVLSRRVARLEVQVDGDVKHQLRQLKQRADSAVAAHRWVMKLIALDDALPQMLVAALAPPHEEMERVVTIKTNTIERACALASQLALFDIDGLLAGFVDHNYGSEMAGFRQRQERILAVAARFHALQLKQVLLLERYTRFILMQNQFWIDMRNGKY